MFVWETPESKRKFHGQCQKTEEMGTRAENCKKELKLTTGMYNGS